VATVPGTPLLIGGRDSVLANGQEVNSSFPRGTFNIHRFSATFGGNVLVSVVDTANTIADPLLQVFDPEGKPIGSASGSINASVGFGAVDTGIYTVIVSEVNNDVALTYEILGTGINLLMPPSSDFNNDGFVTGADFLAWQRGFGTPSASPADGDANGDNNVDAADLSIWETQFGGPAPLAAASSQQAVGSEQLFAVTALPAETVVVQASAVSRRAELIDAAIAIEAIGGGQVAQARLFGQALALDEAVSLDEELVFAETYADRLFAAEARFTGANTPLDFDNPDLENNDEPATDEAFAAFTEEDSQGFARNLVQQL